MEQKTAEALVRAAAPVSLAERYRALIGKEPIAPSAWERHRQEQLARHPGSAAGRFLARIGIRGALGLNALSLALIINAIACSVAAALAQYQMPALAWLFGAVSFALGSSFFWLAFQGGFIFPAHWREVALDRAVPPPLEVFDLIGRISLLMPDVRMTVHELWQEELVDPALELHDDGTGESLIATIWDAPPRIARNWRL